MRSHFVDNLLLKIQPILPNFAIRYLRGLHRFENDYTDLLQCDQNQKIGVINKKIGETERSDLMNTI
jgi:hypothetical protein